MSRVIDDLEIGPSVGSFYSVVLDVQMFVVPHIISPKRQEDCWTRKSHIYSNN